MQTVCRTFAGKSFVYAGLLRFPLGLDAVKFRPDQIEDGLQLRVKIWLYGIGLVFAERQQKDPAFGRVKARCKLDPRVFKFRCQFFTDERILMSSMEDDQMVRVKGYSFSISSQVWKQDGTRVTV